MTTPQVWVSTTSREIEYDGQSPGSAWELVGTISSRDECDFYTYIQVRLGLRSTTRGPAAFYLDGDPDSSWVQAAEHEPFWVAIDPWGEMRTHIHGAKPTFYVSTARATSTSLARRKPEPHPGLTVRPVKIPIRLKRANGELFTTWERSPSE